MCKLQCSIVYFSCNDKMLASYSTLNSCSNIVQIIIIEEDIPFHTVKKRFQIFFLEEEIWHFEIVCSTLPEDPKTSSVLLPLSLIIMAVLVSYMKSKM